MIRYIQYIVVLITVLLSSACQWNNDWSAEETLLLGKVTPIGIAQIGQDIWISDGNNNRLVRIDHQGNTVGQPIEVERPMHISTHEGILYVPSYGIDQILNLKPDGAIDTLAVEYKMDAPAAIDVNGDHTAIADFYNHRILLKHKGEWSEIGGKGKEDGQMHYPTDLQIWQDKLFVADAYNNRGQIFSLSGDHILTFGEEEGFNAATGIYVTDTEVFLTDFENDRVVVFNHVGEVQQVLQEGLSSPADVSMINGELWVLNFAGKYISKFK